jgi:hypothetical protein
MFTKPPSPYETTGTTAPIYIKHGRGAQSIQPGQDYFIIRIHSAQAAFYGSIWQKDAQLLVASQVNLHHPALGNEPIYALRRSRPVERQQAIQLGLSPNLINLVPAVMDRVSLSVDFILDSKNRLHDLVALINDESFLAAVSLAPTGVVAAKIVAGLAQKVVTTLLPIEERKPILQFSGDFTLPTGDLQEGYQVILGTSDDRTPLPTDLTKLDIDGTRLLYDEKPVTQWSYVILEVRRTQARTRDLHEGAAWEAKLREAEDTTAQFKGDPYSGDSERQAAWEKCRALFMEARALIRNDPNYLRTEAETIIKASFNHCAKDLSAKDVHRGGIVKAPRVSWQPDLEQDRRLLGIALDEDLNTTLDIYADQIAATHRMMRELGMMK